MKQKKNLGIYDRSLLAIEILFVVIISMYVAPRTYGSRMLIEKKGCGHVDMTMNMGTFSGTMERTGSQLLAPQA